MHYNLTLTYISNTSDLDISSRKMNFSSAVIDVSVKIKENEVTLTLSFFCKELFLKNEIGKTVCFKLKWGLNCVIFPKNSC